MVIADEQYFETIIIGKSDDKIKIVNEDIL